MFYGNVALASAANNLLVVGFYLLNFGFMGLWLRIDGSVLNTRDAIEALSGKIGLMLLVLGTLPFANLYIFSWIRVQSDQPQTPRGAAHEARGAVKQG